MGAHDVELTTVCDVLTLTINERCLCDTVVFVLLWSLFALRYLNLSRADFHLSVPVTTIIRSLTGELLKLVG